MYRDLQSTSAPYYKHLVFCRSRCQEWYREIEIMASTTASDVLIDSLHDWGVDTIFGLPGDGINGIMEALRTRADKIRLVQVRHEESAAFMACAYASTLAGSAFV